MKYTSQKVDFEQLQEYIKQKGFSDKVKKYVSSILLAAQVISVVPNMAQAHDTEIETPNTIQEVQRQDNKYHLNFGYVDIDGKQKNVQMDTSNIYSANVNMNYVDIDGNLHESNLKIDNSDRAVEDYGNFNEIDRNNIDEFSNRGHESVVEKINLMEEFRWFNGINDFTIEEMVQLKEKGLQYVFFSDATLEEIENGTKQLDLLNAYSPDDMIMIKKYYEKNYGPIRDNPDLTQKEKFHAAMMVLGALNTYDYEAYKPDQPTDYSKAAQFTSRNLYSSVKYGNTICVGYANSVSVICDMLGIENKNIDVISNIDYWKDLSSEKQKEIITNLEEGKKIDDCNHRVNSITFEDGSTYLLDMTNQDALNGAITKIRWRKKLFKILFNRRKEFSRFIKLC